MANAKQSPVTLTQRQIVATVDKLGNARKALAQLKEEVKFLEELLEESCGPGRLVGKQYEANVLWITSTVFDQSKAKSMLTAGQLAECAKPSEFWRVNVKEVA